MEVALPWPSFFVATFRGLRWENGVLEVFGSCCELVEYGEGILKTRVSSQNGWWK